MKQKLRSSGGFTLVETLLSVLIMLLVTTIMMMGIPAAASSYERVVRASNAEVLLSTAVTALRNELGTAQDIETSGTTTIIYYSPTRGASSMIYLDNDQEDYGIMLQRYYFDASDYTMTDGIVPAAEQMVPYTGIDRQSRIDDLYVTFASVTYNETTGIVTINDLSVKRVSGDGVEALTSRDVLSIRVLAK